MESFMVKHFAFVFMSLNMAIYYSLGRGHHEKCVFHENGGVLPPPPRLLDQKAGYGPVFILFS
jgi:hypothetical protein